MPIEENTGIPAAINEYKIFITTPRQVTGLIVQSVMTLLAGGRLQTAPKHPCRMIHLSLVTYHTPIIQALQGHELLALIALQ